MKYLIAFIMVAMSLVAATSFSHAESCTKVWNYGYTGNSFDWSYQFTDQWNGANYQCNVKGSTCGHWDWQSVYYGNCTVVPTPPETNTAEYGDYLVHEQASHDGIVLPSNLGLPTYTVYFDCGSGSMQ